MYSEIWFVKRTKDSLPEKVTLFFRDIYNANATHNKAVKQNDARIMFGSNFPKKISSAWQ